MIQSFTKVITFPNAAAKNLERIKFTQRRKVNKTLRKLCDFAPWFSLREIRTLLLQEGINPKQ